MVLNKNLLIQNGDAVLLLNYRGDRAIQTCKMFESGEYLTKQQFEKINKCLFVGALQYDAEAGLPKRYLCPPPKIQNTLTEWLCSHGVRQFTVAETVKFGHMTYFFNGNRTKPFDETLETWHEVKGDGFGFAQNPKMQADGVVRVAIDAIKSSDFDFIKLNIANPDMVGHTGDAGATLVALREVDRCLGLLVEACKAAGAILVVTSDHGNAEEMTYPDGSPKSSHTNNPVPFVVAGFSKTKIKDESFGLTNIAATVCDIIGIESCQYFKRSMYENNKN